jgi:hypothetical protein
MAVIRFARMLRTDSSNGQRREFWKFPAAVKVVIWGIWDIPRTAHYRKGDTGPNPIRGAATFLPFAAQT